MMKKILNLLDSISPLSVFIAEIIIVAMCAFTTPIMASFSQEAKYEKTWRCPYCYHHWKYGESCQNDKCPSNMWEPKSQQEESVTDLQ